MGAELPRYLLDDGLFVAHPVVVNKHSGFVTGYGGDLASSQLRGVSEKEKVDIWFIDPLMKMEKDQGLICLMILFPLLETIIRLKLEIPEEQDAQFSKGSEELKWFAKFMTISQDSAREVWDAFRNGLLHRAMIKGTIDYTLTGNDSERPAEEKEGGQVVVHVWTLRKKVVEKLKEHHRKLWSGEIHKFPKIHVHS